MSTLEVAALSYAAVGVSYGFFLGFMAEEKLPRERFDLVPMLVAITGTAVWWPLVLVNEVRVAIKRLKRGG